MSPKFVQGENEEGLSNRFLGDVGQNKRKIMSCPECKKRTSASWGKCSWCNAELPTVDSSHEHFEPDFDCDEHIRAAIDELNSRGVSLADFPESTRQRAFILDQEMTHAANAGDQAAFMEALEAWRRCFH